MKYLIICLPLFLAACSHSAGSARKIVRDTLLTVTIPAEETILEMERCNFSDDLFIGDVPDSASVIFSSPVSGQKAEYFPARKSLHILSPAHNIAIKHRDTVTILPAPVIKERSWFERAGDYIAACLIVVFCLLLYASILHIKN